MACTNLDLYPDSYPDIQILGVEDRLLLIKKDLIQEALKNNDATRNIGYMAIINQVALISQGKSIPPSFFSPSDPPIIKPLGKPPVVHVPEVIPVVPPAEPPIIVVIPPVPEPEPEPEPPIPPMEKEPEIMPPIVCFPTPEPEEDNVIPPDEEFFPPITYKGRGGYFVGGFLHKGRGGTNVSEVMQKLSFLNETITLGKYNLATPKAEFAITGEITGFWSFGGWLTNMSRSNNTIERTNYLDDYSFTIATRMSGIRTLASGSSTPDASYVFGGIYNKARPRQPDYPFSRVVEKLTHLNQAINIINTDMLSARSADANCKGNKNYCWFFGGTGVGWQRINTIEKFDFINEAFITTGLVLSESQARHASLGNETNIYLLGGEVDNPSPRWQDAKDIVTKFIMDTETLSPLGITLNATRSHTGGAGSNEFGYILGGWGNAALDGNVNTRVPAQTIEKMDLIDGSESIYNIALQPIYPIATFSSISDYGETFYVE